MQKLRTQIVNVVRQQSAGEKACAEHEVVPILADDSKHDPNALLIVFYVIDLLRDSWAQFEEF